MSTILSFSIVLMEVDSKLAIGKDVSIKLAHNIKIQHICMQSVFFNRVHMFHHLSGLFNNLAEKRVARRLGDWEIGWR